MKKFRKALAVVMCVVMTLTAAPLNGFVGMELPDGSGFKKIIESITSAFDSFSTKAQAATYSGTCGDNLTWSLDTSTGVLNITGTGEMKNWETVSSIPWHSYDGYIKTVNIASGVTTIGEGAFAYCVSLTRITVDTNNKNYSSDSYGVLFNKDKTTLIQYPMGNTRTSYTIPDSLTTIGNLAFYWCESLTTVTIPDGVTTIGEGAFYNCNNLTSVTIPDSVTSIGYYAYYNCTSLTDVYYSGSEEQWKAISIGSYNEPLLNATIHYNHDGTVAGIVDSGTCGENLTWTLYDNGVLNITGTGAMTNWDSPASVPWYSYRSDIKTVNIASGVTTIGDLAFYYCDSLTSVTIPDSVTTIGYYAFAEGTSLTSVTIPDSVTTIGDWAFAYCESLTSVTIPDSVTTIGYYAFYDCTSLTSVTIGNSVTSIGDNAFYYCYSLTSVTIGNSVTTIGDAAFEYCTSLTSITIPDSVTTIGYYAFRECATLTDVYYSGSEEQWKAISIGEYNEPLLNATIHYNYVPESGSSITGVELSGDLPVKSGNTLTFTVTTSTGITKLRMEDSGYIVNEWTKTNAIDNGDGTLTWTVTQIINTIGENRTLDFRAGTADGYEEGVYKSPAFTCIENKQKLPSTTIEHPAMSAIFLQGDEQNLIWTVDGVPGDGVMPDYFIINVFKDNELVFAKRNIKAADYLGNDGKFFYNIDGGYFEETGEYEISVTSVKEGYQYSDDEVVVGIYPPDLYIEGFNSGTEFVNFGEKLYLEGCIKGVSEHIRVFVQTPSMGASHEYFTQDKTTQQFDLSALYPIEFGTGAYDAPGEYYISVYATALGKSEETLLAKKKIVLLAKDVKQLDKPTITSSVVTKTGESYTLTWNSVKNADYYTVIISELGITRTGIETESFVIPQDTFKSAGEYTVLVYAHTYSDNYLTSNNSIKLTVQKSEISCSVLSARIIGSNTIKAGNYLNFEIVTTKDTTKLRLMDKNYVVTEWTDSSNYTDKDGKRYWNVKEIIKTVGVNRKLQFVAGNAEGYSDISAEVTFTCNENPNKLGNITITSPLEGYSYDQNTLQYLVWNIEGEISPDYYIVEIFTNSGSKKYINKNVDGNLLWIEIPAEYFENTGTYTISITAVKEHYQTSSSSVTFISRCTHMHTETTTPTLIKGSYKSSGDSQHTYQTQTVETCINCNTVVNKIVESHTENHYMHEGLLCVCGYYKAQNGFLTLNGLHLQSKNTEYTYLSPTNTLDYWGSVSPSDSGYISMLGKVTRNGVEYAFIRYPLNSGGYKCGFIRAELVSKIPYGQPTATVNGENVNIVYDANGYVYADAEKLFEIIGGKAYVDTQYLSEGKFNSGVQFFHNSYEYGAYETGYRTSNFNSTTKIKWVSSGDKYVIKNGEYYDIEYWLEGTDLNTKKILGGNQKLYTANNRVYFPLSVLTSDICRYEKVSELTYTYNAKWYTSDEFIIWSNNYLDDYIDILHIGEGGYYYVESYDNNVSFKCGENVFGEIKGVPYYVSYGKDPYTGDERIFLKPTTSGVGTVNIYHMQNDKKTILFSKTVHCKPMGAEKNIFTSGVTDNNFYEIADRVFATNITTKKNNNGYNVSFDVYSGRINNFIIRAFDKDGKEYGAYAVCRGNDIETGLIDLGKMYLNHKAMPVAILLNGEHKDIKTLFYATEIKYNVKYNRTRVNLKVPKGGYITVYDASNYSKALDYDIITFYSQKEETLYSYADALWGGITKSIELPKNIALAFDGAYNAFSSVGSSDSMFEAMDKFCLETINTFIDNIDDIAGIGVIFSCTEWAGNLISTHRITEEIRKNAKLYSNNQHKKFGCSSIYIKDTSSYSLRSRSVLNEEESNVGIYDFAPVTAVHNGYFIASVNDKYGLCNINGDFVISPEWRYVNNYSCGIVPAIGYDGCTFLDITGKVLFETNHIFAESFLNNRCLVMGDNYKIGIIDNEGNEIVPCTLDRAWILHDGYILGMTGNEYSVIDPKGKTVCSFDDEFVGLSVDRKVLILQDENGFVGAVRYDGETIAKNNFDGIGGINGNAIAMEKDGTYTVFDLNGKKLFEITADYIGEFFEGVATVIDENGVRLVDMSGNTVVNMSDDVADVYPFKENLAIVYYSDGSYAYMNNQYQIVSDRYSFASDFNDGYAVVSVNENGTEKWAMVNKAFETIHTFDDELEFKQNDFNSGYVFGTSETGATRYTTVGDKGTQKEVLSFEKSQIDLRVEESKQLKTVSQNTSSSLTWISSNPAVAKVDSSGTVIALAVGETTVTVSNGAGVTSSCVIKVLPNNYKVTWIVDGKKTDQVIKFGEKITQPSNPEKVGYTFIGWTPSVPSKMPANDLTFTAQFELLVKELKVKNPSTNTVKYGDTLILHADFGETMLPEGYSILWTVEGAGFNMAPAADGLTCNMTSVANGNATVKATLVDENGEAVLDAEGNEMSDTKELKSNASFWQKIVSFFKNLFRINRIISE